MLCQVHDFGDLNRPSLGGGAGFEVWLTSYRCLRFVLYFDWQLRRLTECKLPIVLRTFTHVTPALPHRGQDSLALRTLLYSKQDTAAAVHEEWGIDGKYDTEYGRGERPRRNAQHECHRW